MEGFAIWSGWESCLKQRLLWTRPHLSPVLPNTASPRESGPCSADRRVAKAIREPTSCCRRFCEYERRIFLGYPNQLSSSRCPFYHDGFEEKVGSHRRISMENSPTCFARRRSRARCRNNFLRPISRQRHEGFFEGRKERRGSSAGAIPQNQES